jgi:hypothetical protein
VRYDLNIIFSVLEKEMEDYSSFTFGIVLF